MTNFHAVTASSTAQITDRAAVRALCKRYSFGMLHWELTDDNQFFLRGEETLDIRPTTGDGTRDHTAESMTTEFFTALAQYLHDGEVLDIQSVGYEGCLRLAYQ